MEDEGGRRFGGGGNEFQSAEKRGGELCVLRNEREREEA
jgi:hypothetical protein